MAEPENHTMLLRRGARRVAVPDPRIHRMERPRGPRVLGLAWCGPDDQANHDQRARRLARSARCCGALGRAGIAKDVGYSLIAQDVDENVARASGPSSVLSSLCRTDGAAANSEPP